VSLLERKEEGYFIYVMFAVEREGMGAVFGMYGRVHCNSVWHVVRVFCNPFRVN
jgi:hypothetical protein